MRSCNALIDLMCALRIPRLTALESTPSEVGDVPGQLMFERWNPCIYLVTDQEEDG
jgi:hypothetical protein